MPQVTALMPYTLTPPTRQKSRFFFLFFWLCVQTKNFQEQEQNNKSNVFRGDLIKVGKRPRLHDIASAVLTRQWFVWQSVQPKLLPHFLELGELAPAFNRSHRIKTLSVSVFRLTIFFGEKMQSAFVTISLSATGHHVERNQISF